MSQQPETQTNVSEVLRTILDNDYSITAKRHPTPDLELINQPGELAGWASVELLRRFDRLSKALAPEPQCKANPLVVHQNSPVFPDSKVGDFLYRYREFGGSVEKYLIVSMDEQHHVVLIECDWSDWDYPAECFVPSASGSYFRTPEDALADLLDSHSQFLNRFNAACDAAKQAIANGEDLTRFLNGTAFDLGDPPV